MYNSNMNSNIDNSSNSNNNNKRWARRRWRRVLRKGDATVTAGTPHRAQILSIRAFRGNSISVNSSLSSNSRQQYLSQQHPPPLLILRV